MTGKSLEAILLGVPLTLLITLASFTMGAILAIPLVAMRRSRIIALRLLARGFIDLLRGVPLIVWLFILYYGISIGTFRFSPIPASILGFGVITSAYLAEIYRGAILSVPAGQAEASHALGLTRLAGFFLIIAPQAVRVALPSATTYAIGLLKDSSIASVIGVTEIMFITQSEARASNSGLVLYLVAAALYITMSFPMGLLSRFLDARVRGAVLT